MQLNTKKVVVPRLIALLALFGVFAFAAAPAYAIPSFGRQMGVSCATCHTVMPDLNAFGRQFKLRGYTLGARLDSNPFPYNLPLSAGLQVGNTAVKDRSNGANPEEDFPQSNKTIVQQFALYYGGKVAGKVGAMVQYNWDGVEKKWGAEMGDIRYADSTTAGGKNLVYGLSVANSPTVQDLWNTSPMWFFPHTETAGILPMNTSLFDMTLDNQIGAVALYGMYDAQFYGEVGFFRNGRRGIFKPLNAGAELTTAIDGNAPHLRFAWEKNVGPHSFEIGTHVLRADIFPDPQNLNGPTDRFTDYVLDGQYQYGAGAHLFSLHAFYDHEKRSWDATFPAGMASNPSDKLNTFKASAHYWYQRKYGGGIGYFDYRGDTDEMKYAMADEPSAQGNALGSPNTRGWMAEVNWLPLANAQNLKLGLRYTAYSKFNGASNDYNGFGRNASDNNSWFAYIWLLY